MSQREKLIEDAYVAYAEAHGWLARKAVYSGRRGSPDRWFFRNGKLVLVEFKRPGETPDGLQVKEHKALKDHGFPVLVIDRFTDDMAAELFA